MREADWLQQARQMAKYITEGLRIVRETERRGPLLVQIVSHPWMQEIRDRTLNVAVIGLALIGKVGDIENTLTLYRATLSGSYPLATASAMLNMPTGIIIEVNRWSLEGVPPEGILAWLRAERE